MSAAHQLQEWNCMLDSNKNLQLGIHHYSTMLGPFQRLSFCAQQEEKPVATIFMASGATIYALDAFDGKIRAKWPPDCVGNEKEGGLILQQSCEESPDNERPAKVPKLSPILVGEQKLPQGPITGERGIRTKTQSFSSSSVTKLRSTADGKYLVVATGEDKSIHVFSSSKFKVLEHLSQREMPKRPNALSFTESQSTVLCGDKFGDVYAMPLLESDSSPQIKAFYAKSIDDKRAQVQERYKPAANSSTIHTKRNQEALKMQQKMEESVNTVKSQKPEILFDHKLLLGHVSLLTDVISVTTSVGEMKRNYILTSDRDEHIRVSRGIPQTHIIEGFCLGHTEFVSKMCIPRWNRKLLISGGGDEYLMTWDWTLGESKQKFKLREAIETVVTGFPGNEKLCKGFEEFEIAVAGIWAMQMPKEKEGQIIIAFEGLPAILTLHLGVDGELRHQQILTTSHNVLDVAVDESKLRIIYSLDNYHRPFSTKDRDEPRSGQFIGIHSFSANAQYWNDECNGPLASSINSWAKSQKPLGNRLNTPDLSDLFYSVGKLRKRGGDDVQAAD